MQEKNQELINTLIVIVQENKLELDHVNESINGTDIPTPNI